MICEHVLDEPIGSGEPMILDGREWGAWRSVIGSLNRVGVGALSTGSGSGFAEVMLGHAGWSP